MYSMFNHIGKKGISVGGRVSEVRKGINDPADGGSVCCSGGHTRGGKEQKERVTTYIVYTAKVYNIIQTFTGDDDDDDDITTGGDSGQAPPKRI